MGFLSETTTTTTTLRTVITVLAIEYRTGSPYGCQYIERTKRLIDTHLKYTDFDILVGTNLPDQFKEYGDRVKIHILMPSELEEEWGDKRNADYDNAELFFKYTSKFDLLRVASDIGYDVYYSLDADSFINGWDQESFEEHINCGLDISVSHISKDARVTLYGWHPSRLQVYNEFLNANNLKWNIYGKNIIENDRVERGCREDRVLFTSTDALVQCLDVFDKIYDLPRYNDTHSFKYGIDGIFYSVAFIATRLKVGMVQQQTYKFTDYELIESSQGIITDRWIGDTTCTFEEDLTIPDSVKEGRTRYFRDILGLS